MLIITQYEVEVEDKYQRMHRTVFYGKLCYILVCYLSNKPSWRTLKGTTRLLAAIQPCDIQLQGKARDATKSIVFYSNYSTMVVVDLAAVTCVVGRVQSRKKWYILDRSGGLVQTSFVSGNDFKSEDDADSDTD